MTSLFLIDSHSHIHGCFDIVPYFNFAFDNFSKFAVSINNTSNWIGVLLLAEISGQNYFKALANSEIPEVQKNFTIIKTDEEESFLIQNAFNQKIIVVAGKQIITREGIELLALGTTKNFQLYEVLSDSMEAVLNTGAIAVLPWGVGKWTGKKKNMIKKLIENDIKTNFFLGDNSGRLKIWFEPHLFKLAKLNNRAILAGSDALPISSEIDKTGSYGFFLTSGLDLNIPWEGLKKELLDLKELKNTFGKLENPVNFVLNQFLMQINKFKPKHK